MSALQHHVNSHKPLLIGANVGNVTLYAVRDVRRDYLSSDLVRSNALHGIGTSGGLDYTRWINEGCIAGPFFDMPNDCGTRSKNCGMGVHNACPVVEPRPSRLSFRPIDIPRL
jgi:hypothetical protein